MGRRPGPNIHKLNFDRRRVPCPVCLERGDRTICSRHSIGTRRLKELGIFKPTILEVTYSKHFCPVCKKYFSVPMDHIALPHSRFTKRVQRTAVKLVIQDSMTFERSSIKMWQKYFVKVPATTIYDWVLADRKN